MSQHSNQSDGKEENAASAGADGDHVRRQGALSRAQDPSASKGAAHASGAHVGATSGSKRGAKSSKKKGKASFWKRLFLFSAFLALVGVVVGAVGVVWALLYYGRDLPDYRQLASYDPAVVTRVHAGDGSLIREFSREPRIFVPIEVVPERLKLAFLSAEDKNFYEHSGIDWFGLVKAQARNVGNFINGRRLHGGSTISQQVARNFLLTLDREVGRKIKEIILTLRIEKAYSKDRILELYLNEINFGNQSYGIAAAALNYFNKSLNELTIAEMAYLAGLPKGPANYHPVYHKERAVIRRNWVLSRMYDLGHISTAEYEAAQAEDLVMRPRTITANFRADYYAEEVRRRLKRLYGDDTLYDGGLSVRTSLEPRLQAIAEDTLKQGLIAYDRRHGWRGALARIDVSNNWQDALKGKKRPLGVDSWRLAAVLDVLADGAVIGVDGGETGYIPFEKIKWARAWRTGERLGPNVKDIGEVLHLGDVIVVERARSGSTPVSAVWPERTSVKATLSDGSEAVQLAFNHYELRQIPDIQGALVAMDPHTGRVLAMVGGFDFDVSQFNRATQAARQPGSAFKPFVYAAALEQGFTPASLVLDAPFVIDQGNGLGKWKPKNSSNKFYGPSTLRLGIEKSRNLMTVRLAQNIGMGTILDYAERFGLADKMEPSLAASLGAAEVTPLELTAAYGMLVNGGKKITPSLIDRVQDRRGKTIYKFDQRDCLQCRMPWSPLAVSEPDLADNRAQLIDSITAYQMVSMMEGVVTNGTGRRINALGKPLAGKTGTTNDAQDAWFVGFSPDLVVGVFTGFDRPRPLGFGEEGSSVAVPIFKDFMEAALANQPAVPFRVPPGVQLVRINADTGQPARPGDERVIREAFRPGTEPRVGEYAVLDGSLTEGDEAPTIKRGTGGIY